MSRGGSITPGRNNSSSITFSGRKRANSEFNEFEGGTARRLPESLVSMRSGSFGRTSVGSSKDSIHRTLLKDESAEFSINQKNLQNSDILHFFTKMMIKCLDRVIYVSQKVIDPKEKLPKIENIQNLKNNIFMVIKLI